MSKSKRFNLFPKFKLSFSCIISHFECMYLIRLAFEGIRGVMEEEGVNQIKTVGSDLMQFKNEDGGKGVVNYLIICPNQQTESGGRGNMLV